MVRRQQRLAEGTLTEIPEHLLNRSKSRRSALGLGGDDDALAGADAPSSSAAPATTGGAAPATTAAAGPTAEFTTPAKPKAGPKPPPAYVQAALERRRIPVWAMPVLAFLPVWAIMYVGTLSEADTGGMTALAAGAEVYTGQQCAACHGASGGGGSGPAFSGGAILQTFPEPGDHIRWVTLGSDGWRGEVGDSYGANNKPVVGGMPGYADLDIHDLLFVVRHERENLGGETFDPEVWAPILEELVADTESGIDAEFIELFLADGIVGGGD